MVRALIKVLIVCLALGFGFSFLPMILHDLLVLFDAILLFAQENLGVLVTGYICAALTVIAFRLRSCMDPNQVLEEILKSNQRMEKTLDSIEQALRPEGAAAAVEFYTTINGAKEKVDKMFMKIDQIADLSVAFKDKLGNLAKVDGVPAWSLTDASLAKLDIAADGMSAVLALGAVGKFQVQVKADADLGEGVREIIGTLDVEVSALEAEIVELSAVIRP